MSGGKGPIPGGNIPVIPDALDAVDASHVFQGLVGHHLRRVRRVVWGFLVLCEFERSSLDHALLNPDEEPASILLERMQGEREEAEKLVKVGRRKVTPKAKWLSGYLC